ncbi:MULTISPECIES: hypothetical protein [Pseudomonas]|jgi:hypothetical protein|uniref:Transmembrane protein n=1 Tax=Pseudomonas putida TaxID=303 RepID=A0A1L7NNX0_PSEPU|nr:MULTISPECIES: hypothetical protein [Pseudomonas]HCF2574688.1 hypothetical protein [Pseudomonas aeruginosa]AGN82371.1 hypothetical protein L483_15620 [Pseudomonas putida H8234]ELS0927156.1 hypothetical protein [Pseudomonas putida]KYC18824.1 hypothetical protein WM94_19055 [Pseudomonas sp. ABFPK]MBA1319797.1 hypothetical protein [Pseudomonas monteilii]
MNQYKIVERELARAEALIAGYLGLYAGSIDLAYFNAASLKRVTPEFKRCVQVIQDLAAMPVVSQSATRNMVTAVDRLADLVRAPQMKPSTRTLWAIEDWIRRTPLAVVRHLAAIVGPVAAGIWGTIDSSAEADVGVAIAAALVMLSFGCSLSHLRDPDHSIQKGLLAFLGAGALILVTKGVLLTFFAFAVISAGFFIRDVAVWCRRSKSGAGAGNRGGDELFEGNDSLYTPEELYDIGGGPGPALSEYGLAKDDD